MAVPALPENRLSVFSAVMSSFSLKFSTSGLVGLEGCLRLALRLKRTIVCSCDVLVLNSVNANKQNKNPIVNARTMPRFYLAVSFLIVFCIDILRTIHV